MEGQEAPLFYFLKKEGVLIQLSRHQNIFQFIEGLAAARLMEARDNVENSPYLVACALKKMFRAPLSFMTKLLMFILF